MYGPPPKIRPQQPKIPKPKSIKEVPSYLGKIIGGFFSRYIYIFKLVWETSPLILFVMTFSAIFNGILPIAGAYITAQLLNELVAGYTYAQEFIGTLSSSEIFETVLDKVNVIYWLIAQFAYLIVDGILGNIYNAIVRISGEKVANHIKEKIITKAKDIDLAEFDKPQFYEKFENASREASHRPISILSATFNMLSVLISAVSFIIVLVALNPIAPLIVILFALPAAIVRFIYGRKNFLYVRRHSKDRRQMDYYSSIMTNKDMVKEIKIFHLSDTFISKFKSTFRKYYQGLKKLIVRENIWHSVITISTAFVNTALFIYVAVKVCSGELNVGDYSFYANSLRSIITCVATLVASTATIYEGTLFIDNIISFKDLEATVIPSVNPPEKVKHHIAHSIEFKNVFFAYPGSETYTLKNISFKLEAGTTAVLVGLNGAGKTTLIKLLTRLYDVSEGVILLDGKDIREYDVEDLYSIYGIIFQDFGKYAVNVDENIYFGNISKGFDEEDIKKAAKESGADIFINQLPKNYKTPLMKYFEENGTELSIGQWQKLSVARAFYADSDILILDEPTASLDAIAEQQIFSQFDNLRKDKTTIFVSHRLSSATTADTIIVIDNGELVEIGNHKELMQKKGKYYTLFSTQAKRYIENQ